MKVSLAKDSSAKSSDGSFLKRVVPPSNSKASPKKTVAKQKEEAEGKKNTETNSPVKESAFNFSPPHRIGKQTSVPNGGCTSRSRHQSDSPITTNPRPPLTSSTSSPPSLKTSPSSDPGLSTRSFPLEDDLLDKLSCRVEAAKDGENEGRAMNYIEVDHSESNENLLSRGAACPKTRNPSGPTGKDGGLTYSVIDFTKSEGLKGTTTLSISRHS